MKCPHCEYEHNWKKEGSEGEFYIMTNQIEMERTAVRYWEKDTKEVYGCPSCGKLFIEIYKGD